MPSPTHGKICYIELPTQNVARSADFYAKTFNWKIRTRGDGATAFDDITGYVSGAFVQNRAPASPGLLVYIMVDNAAEMLQTILANGGEITQPIGADHPEITARFKDPGGNILGIYQEPVQPIK